MDSKPSSSWTIATRGAHRVIAYAAMASPCEILVATKKAGEAEHLASLAFRETLRIEHKFSRYLDTGVVYAINHSDGTRVDVDGETSRLLQYAGQCFQLSEGRFDVTSGVLRRAWTFDGREVTPDHALIEKLRAQVGWNRVEFDGDSIRLERGMEIDLGGIGKEYAADRVADVLAAETSRGVMVNLGGDIRATRDGNQTWTIGIEDPGHEKTALGQLQLASGGVATSGDARRFCYVNGVRLGHILDPRTGWPVAGAPRSVTVVADTCTAAGFLATLAMLHGAEAEMFLAAQDVVHHCVR
jgi:thiamine biosynthesis lipoprotein